MTAPIIYCDYHYPTIFFAEHNGETYIIPSTPTGWGEKRAWSPSPLLRKQILSDANVAFRGHPPAMIELALGIPKALYEA